MIFAGVSPAQESGRPLHASVCIAHLPVAVPVHALVVEDDNAIRQMITDYLTDNDLRVRALPDGREISDLTARDLVNVLILDLKLVRTGYR